jgi:peptidoglycan/xylan/chitin deacetylase (PgdA/CDA1 family)
MPRPIGILTVDLEDYRRQELRDHWRADEAAHPREVERQLEGTLALFDAIDARATFFTVGRLVSELAPSAWRELLDRHRMGCHGYEHLRIWKMGPAHFKQDLLAAKAVLEDLAGQPIISHRAPYFSSDGCDPWFGEILAQAGILIDSSRRLRQVPPGFRGALPLEGGGGAVQEVPLASIGFGPKRITIIGGTYMRVLPLAWIVRLLEQAQAQGFLPMVYLHPYDLDPTAPPLEYDRLLGHLWPRLGDRIRRLGRHTIADKMRALAQIYQFQAIESLVEPVEAVPTPESRWKSPAVPLNAEDSLPASLEECRR